ncbi:MAG: GNAT family N-acetyltransferase, partial [Thermoleophilaceae bacterium]
HPVFSVATAGGLAERAGAQERATSQARDDATDTPAVAELEAAGMRVVNLTHTLTADPQAPVPAGAVEVREADPEQDEEVLDVAERSFRYTRFHLDPQVPQAVADRIKRDWVSSYLNGLRGDELLVALGAGRPVGFLCGLPRTDGERRVRVIDLFGVAPEARRSGAGLALVRAFHERARGRCDAVEVGTQAANTPAIVFYERLGYLTARAAYDLHMHVG